MVLIVNTTKDTSISEEIRRNISEKKKHIINVKFVCAIPSGLGGQMLL